MTDQTPGGSYPWKQAALWSSVVLLGLAAFAVSLLVYMPAQFAVRQMDVAIAPDRVSGTIWQGAAQLDDAHSVTWETSALASLRRMAGVVNWRITGPGTDIVGRVFVPLRSRGDRGSLDAVEGNVAWPLIAAILPGLDIRCEARAKITGLRMTLAPGLRTAEGSFAATAGVCARSDGSVTDVPTPALVAKLTTDADGLLAVLTTDDAALTPLATARLTNADRLVVTVHAAGAAMVPGMPSSADSELDLPLSALLP